MQHGIIEMQHAIIEADDAPAESPFLPDTQLQFAWDSTSIGWLKTCPRLYFYQMVEGWRTRGESVHLRFGTEYHAALELYDKLRAIGSDHEDALREVVHETLRRTYGWTPDPLHKAAGLKNRFTLIRTVVWYLDQFQDDPAATLILANGKPAVELTFKMNFDGPYMLTGHLDRVVEFGGGTYVMDRKTSSSTIGGYYFDKFSPDNQMTLYTLAAKIVFKTPVKGVIIDAAQIAVGFSRFARGFAYRTEGQLSEWLADTRFWISQAERFADQGYWPMNDKSCDKFGGCPFREVCSKDPGVRETFLRSDFEKQFWNPLEAR